MIYLRSPEICKLEKILTSPPYSLTDSTNFTYSFRRLIFLHLKLTSSIKFTNSDIINSIINYRYFSNKSGVATSQGVLNSVDGKCKYFG